VRRRELLLELLDLLAEVVVLLQQATELGFDEVEERVHLVLVVAPLPDRRLAERDVVNVGRGQRHRISSSTPRLRNPRYLGLFELRDTQSTTSASDRTIMDGSSDALPSPPEW
jgi:hypothetical protein